jgi:CspA family cold shock protein
MTGVVTEFDEPAGFGTVTAEDGEAHFFHCTAIADGTRTIDVGAKVRFEVVAGRQGRWEAADLRPDAPTA